MTRRDVLKWMGATGAALTMGLKDALELPKKNGVQRGGIVDPSVLKTFLRDEGFSLPVRQAGTHWKELYGEGIYGWVISDHLAMRGTILEGIPGRPFHFRQYNNEGWIIGGCLLNDVPANTPTIAKIMTRGSM